MRWTSEEELKLANLIKSGKTIEQISKDFGRTENALNIRMMKIMHEMHENGKSVAVIGKEFGITAGKVSEMISGYKDVGVKKKKHRSLEEILESIDSRLEQLVERMGKK